METGWRNRYIRHRSEIDEIFRRGERRAEREFTVFFLRNGLPVSRFGVIIPRRWGKAAKRNRARRQVREIIRRWVMGFSGGMDLLLMPRAGAERLSYGEKRRALERLLKQIGVMESEPDA